MIHHIHPDDGFPRGDRQILQVPLLILLGDTCMQLLTGTNLFLQQALGVTLSSRVWYLPSAFLYLGLRLLWFIKVSVVGCLLIDLLPNRGGHGTPFLDLFGIKLVHLPVRLRVLLLPPDRVEVGTELRQTIQLDCSHLLLTVDNVVHHLVNMIGLLLIVL